MKKVVFILLLLIASLATRAQEDAPLLLISQGNEEIMRYNPRLEQVMLMREEMESLIREGNFPIVIECKNKVVWLYLNDPDNGRDYPIAKFKSEYFEFLDLFCIKLTKRLRLILEKSGNKALLDTLGIEYAIRNDSVFSKINYDKFDKFAL